MYFLCSFSKFLGNFTKILYINTSILSKILAAGLDQTYYVPLGYTSVTLLYPPLAPHYEFMILFDFHTPSVKSLPETTPFWYPDIYPDNLLSDKRISG